MAILRNKKITALNRKDHEDHLWDIQARNTNHPRFREEYINQVSEKIEDRVTKKLSEEFSEPEGHILGALSRVEEILLIPHALADSGPVPETTRIFSE